MLIGAIGCKGTYSEYTKTTFVFDTYAIISIKESDGSVSNKTICDNAVLLLNELDNDLSPIKNESELSYINANASKAPIQIKEYVFDLIRDCVDICEKTNGCFDITLWKITKLYGFIDGNSPRFDEIEKLKNKKNYKNIVLDNENKTIFFLNPDFELDLGAVAKGYALDRLTELFYNSGVKSAVIDLGGCIKVIGNKKTEIGITCDDTDEAFAKIAIYEQAVSTSNGSKRFIEFNGVKYHHIIDASTAAPAESNVQSVTVISESGMLADALSTALFVNGDNEPYQIISFFDDCSYVIRYKNKEVAYSEELKDKILIYE